MKNTLFATLTFDPNANNSETNGFQNSIDVSVAFKIFFITKVNKLFPS